MVNNWVLDYPPRLDQHSIYDFPERAFACWATCAEMVVKWKNKTNFFERPTFNPPLLADTEDGFSSRIRYFEYCESMFARWGFESLGSAYCGNLTHERIATLLHDRGPLVCYGKFLSDPSVSSPLLAHAVVVYGCTSRFGGIYFTDPWDSMEKKMPLHSFSARISTNTNAIQAWKKNYRTTP